MKDIRAVDLDQDGDIDVISACISSDSIHWHENLGTQNFVTHTISNTADGAHGVDYGDFDGDGFIDIVSASLADNTIALYSNDGSQNFTKLVLSNTIISPWVVTTTDLDSDGDLDLLVGANGENTTFISLKMVGMPSLL